MWNLSILIIGCRELSVNYAVCTLLPPKSEREGGGEGDYGPGRLSVGLSEGNEVLMISLVLGAPHRCNISCNRKARDILQTSKGRHFIWILFAFSLCVGYYQGWMNTAGCWINQLLKCLRVLNLFNGKEFHGLYLLAAWDVNYYTSYVTFRLNSLMFARDLFGEFHDHLQIAKINILQT